MSASDSTYPKQTPKSGGIMDKDELNKSGELSDDELDKVAGGEEYGVVISPDEIVGSFLKAMEQYRKDHPKD